VHHPFQRDTANKNDEFIARAATSLTKGAGHLQQQGANPPTILKNLMERCNKVQVSFFDRLFYLEKFADEMQNEDDFDVFDVGDDATEAVFEADEENDWVGPRTRAQKRAQAEAMEEGRAYLRVGRGLILD
jgi:hypothetical protein